MGSLGSALDVGLKTDQGGGTNGRKPSPREHDHPRTARQAFEEIVASLNYDGADTDSLTVGEIRRALP